MSLALKPVKEFENFKDMIRKTILNREKIGNLRVFNIINPPNDGIFYPVKDVDHARKLIDALADSQLLQKEIISNVFGLEIYTKSGWEDWEDEDGFNFDEHFDELEKNQV